MANRIIKSNWNNQDRIEYPFVKIPDFIAVTRDEFMALYITSPRLLRHDNPVYRGIPFVGYTGESEEMDKLIAFQRGKSKIPYIPKGALTTEGLLKNTNVLWAYADEVEIPRAIKLGREEILTKDLYSQSIPYNLGSKTIEIHYGEGPIMRDFDNWRRIVQRASDLPSLTRIELGTDEDDLELIVHEERTFQGRAPSRVIQIRN